MKTTLQRYIQPATIVIWGLVCFCFSNSSINITSSIKSKANSSCYQVNTYKAILPAPHGLPAFWETSLHNSTTTSMPALPCSLGHYWYWATHSEEISKRPF